MQPVQSSSGSSRFRPPPPLKASLPSTVLAPINNKRSPSSGIRTSNGLSTGRGSSSPTGITPSRSQPNPYDDEGISNELNRDLYVTPASPMSPTSLKSPLHRGALSNGTHRHEMASDPRLRRSPTSSRWTPSPEVNRPPLQFKSGCGTVVHEYDKTNGACLFSYRCGDLLGQGGFAKVYDFVEINSNERYACKIVDKEKLKPESTRRKFFAEVEIHQRLKHPNVLNFIRYFDDDHYYYLLLERCCRYSLMDLHMSKGVFTVPEIKHIMIQLLTATSFLHSNLVIHRDLKLGNIMIDPYGNVKVGDFGFATQLSSQDERKVTMCGTPNYIAPEVLKPEDSSKASLGYSFSADIWSLGVILFTLAVGKPPFETKEVQTTYNLIRRCEYHFPEGSLTNPSFPIPHGVKAMVGEMLQLRPEDRSSLIKLRQNPFLSNAPSTAPLTLVNLDAEISPVSRSPISIPDYRQPAGSPKLGTSGRSPSPSFGVTSPTTAQPTVHTSSRVDSEKNVLGSRSPTSPEPRQLSASKAREPVSLPSGIAVTQYAYFPKYGWCYRALQADGRVMIGVTLNDCTKVLSDDASGHIWYYNREKAEDRHMDQMYFFPSTAAATAMADTAVGVGMSLHKKISILNFLRNFMAPSQSSSDAVVHTTATSYFGPIAKLIKSADQQPPQATPKPPVIIKQFQQHNAIPNLPQGILMSTTTMRLSNGLYQHSIHVSACDVSDCVCVVGYGPCVSPWVLDFTRTMLGDSEVLHIVFASQLSRQCFPATVFFENVLEVAQRGSQSPPLDVGALRLPWWLCSQIAHFTR